MNLLSFFYFFNNIYYPGKESKTFQKTSLGNLLKSSSWGKIFPFSFSFFLFPFSFTKHIPAFLRPESQKSALPTKSSLAEKPKHPELTLLCLIEWHQKATRQLSLMGRPKRKLLATAAETSSPPPALDAGHAIALVKKAEGNNLYSVELPAAKEPLLVELPSRFRSQIWIKRGGYVVVNTSAFDSRENKLGGEIVNVVRDEKQWRKQAYWLVTQVSKG